MNRNDEYNELLCELEQIPPKAEYAVSRAVAKRKKRHRLRAFGLGFASFFVAFVLAVNVFPAVAYAAGQIPILRELAKAVSFSPSLEAAVENEYVQPMNLTQTQNGITVNVEYLIVDMKNVSVFYTITSEDYNRYFDDVSVKKIDGSGLPVASMSFGAIQNGEIATTSIMFTSGTVPSEFLMELKVEAPNWQGENGMIEPVTRPPDEDISDEHMLFDTEYTPPEYIAEFTFHLEFDPYYTEQGETFTLNKDVKLDDQSITITDLEIYPTQMRMGVLDGEGNSTFVKSLDFYLENEKGEIYERAGGITAFGSPDSDETIYNIDSDFFSKSESLTLHITNATFLDKEHSRVYLDLVNETADFLPNGVEFDSAEKYDSGYILKFEIEELQPDHFHQVFMNTYYDKDENIYDITTYSSYSHDDGYFFEEFPLVDFHDDEVWIDLYYTELIEFEEPVSVKLK